VHSILGNHCCSNTAIYEFLKAVYYHGYSENQATITRRLHLFLANVQNVCMRAAWEVPGLERVLEHEFLHFPDG